jgi:hypothetical protein
MPTRIDVTISAGADSLAAALRPLVRLSRSVAALLAAAGLGTPTTAGRPTSVRAPSLVPDLGGAA